MRIEDGSGRYKWLYKLAREPNNWERCAMKNLGLEGEVIDVDLHDEELKALPVISEFKMTTNELMVVRIRVEMPRICLAREMVDVMPITVGSIRVVEDRAGFRLLLTDDDQWNQQEVNFNRIRQIELARKTKIEMRKVNQLFTMGENTEAKKLHKQIISELMREPMINRAYEEMGKGVYAREVAARVEAI